MPLNDTTETISPNAPRRSLVLIAIAAAIPIVLFTAWVVFIDANQQRSDARLFAQRTISRVVARINNELNMQVEIAEILANSPSLDTGDLAQFYTEAARISNTRPLWETVALVDPSGQQLANLFRPLGSELGKTSDRNNFDKVLETRKPVIGGVGPVGPLSGRRLLALRVPAIRDGEVKYVVTVGLAPDAISLILRSAGVPPGWIGAVVDANGNILARTVDEQFELGKPESPDVRGAISRASSGEYIGRTLEGVEVESVYQSLAGVSGWSVHLGIPTDELNRSVIQSIIFLAASGAVSLLLAFILAALSARDISLRRREQDAQAALALKVSEQRRALAIHAADLGVLSLDTRSERMATSRRTRELLEMEAQSDSVQELPLSDFLNHIDERDRAAVTRGLAGALSSEPNTIEFRTPSGNWRQFNSHSSASLDGEGVVNGVILDINAAKQLERDRLKLLRRLSDAQENERRRIARELHDQIGQVVTGLLLGLKSLEQSIGPGRDAAGSALEQIQRLQKLADDIGKDIHQVAADLRPTAVDDLGVARALDAFCADWSKRSDIHIDLQTLGSQKRMPADVEIAIYRIVQEAVNNVVKHAQAHNISIVIDQRTYEYRIIVEDDGIGLPAASSSHELRIGSSGLGLSGIRERLALLGGSLSIEGGPGTGTTLFATIPLTSGTADEAVARHAFG